MKICSKCKTKKELSEFYRNKAQKDGFNNQCKICHVEHNKKDYEKHKEKRVTKNKQYRNENLEADKIRKRDYRLKLSYGISFEQKCGIIKTQNGKCAICNDELKTPKHTHLDHDHITGKVRGVLCNHCNRGLGGFKDSQTFLLKAVEYLFKHNG
jgi:hypothetical protein